MRQVAGEMVDFAAGLHHWDFIRWYACMGVHANCEGCVLGCACTPLDAC